MALLCTRLALKLRHRTVHRVFLQWGAWCSEQKRLTHVGALVARQWKHRTLHYTYTRWLDHVERRRWLTRFFLHRETNVQRHLLTQTVAFLKHAATDRRLVLEQQQMANIVYRRAALDVFKQLDRAASARGKQGDYSFLSIGYF